MKKKTNTARKIHEEIDIEENEQRQGTAIQKGLGETDQYSTVLKCETDQYSSTRAGQEKKREKSWKISQKY